MYFFRREIIICFHRVFSFKFKFKTLEITYYISAPKYITVLYARIKESPHQHVSTHSDYEIIVVMMG